MLATIKSFAQEIPVSSDKVTISGKVKTEVAYTTQDLNNFTKTNVGDVEFTDGKEKKYTGHAIQGISLEQLF